MVRRFWFEFERFAEPTPLNLGCGVTAYDLDDAIDPNAPGDMSYTPLHYAYWKRPNDVVELLLAHGARPDILNEFGKLPEEDADDSPED